MAVERHLGVAKSPTLSLTEQQLQGKHHNRPSYKCSKVQGKRAERGNLALKRGEMELQLYGAVNIYYSINQSTELLVKILNMKKFIKIKKGSHQKNRRLYKYSLKKPD